MIPREERLAQALKQGVTRMVCVVEEYEEAGEATRPFVEGCQNWIDEATEALRESAPPARLSDAAANVALDSGPDGTRRCCNICAGPYPCPEHGTAGAPPAAPAGELRCDSTSTISGVNGTIHRRCKHQMGHKGPCELLIERQSIAGPSELDHSPESDDAAIQRDWTAVREILHPGKPYCICELCTALSQVTRSIRMEARREEAERDLEHNDTYEGSCGVHMERFCGKCQRLAELDRAIAAAKEKHA